MFTAVKLTLRNALTLAKGLMHLTEENYQANMAVINLLSPNRYLLLGIGEDVVGINDYVGISGDRLEVDEGAIEPGVVTFTKATYDFAMLLRDVVLDGHKVSFEIQKKYDDLSIKTFTDQMMPLKSDNFQLIVTIQPGGYLRRAALLQEIVME